MWGIGVLLSRTRKGRLIETEEQIESVLLSGWMGLESLGKKPWRTFVFMTSSFTLDVPVRGGERGGRKILLALNDEQFPECSEKPTENQQRAACL